MWFGFKFAIGYILAIGLIFMVGYVVVVIVRRAKTKRPKVQQTGRNWENGFTRSFRNIFG